MQSTVINEIMAFLFGRRYYANVIRTKGTTKEEICSFIFTTRQQAEAHRQEIESTLSFVYVCTITFRSRKVHVEEQ